MKSNIRVILALICCMTVLAFSGVVGAQSMDKMDEMGSMDKMDSMDSMMMDVMPMSASCAMLPPDIMVSTSMKGVQCQPVSGAGIGVQSILAGGVIAAVDVWGMMDISAEVCFSGSGSITFLDATTAPRTQMSLEYSMKDGMTCADIMHAGTVVLMPSMMMDDMAMMDDMDKMDDMAMMDDMEKMDDMAMMDDMDKMDDMAMMDDMEKMDDMAMMDDMDKMDDMEKMDDMAMMDDMEKMAKIDKMNEMAMVKDSMDSMVPLEDCEVTARYNLNFRAEPAGELIGLVPGGTTKTAIARTENWYKVVHDDTEGWISSHFIDDEGDCG